MQTSLATNKITNHIGWILDKSWSMDAHKETVVKVVDGEISWTAKRSQEMDQETRITIWTFSSHGLMECLIWDTDVLRIPSIAGHYRPSGNTALIDAFLQAIDDMKTTSQRHGKHTFFLCGASDGEENDSVARYYPDRLPKAIADLDSNWDVGLLVPDKSASNEAKRHGFPGESIKIWNSSGSHAAEEMGGHFRQATEAMFQARARGETSIRGSLFRVKALSEGDLAGLVPLTRGSYVEHGGKLPSAAEDMRIDVFAASHAGRYIPGSVYYRLTKPETVQDYKQVAVRDKNGSMYLHPDLRVRLGLPPLAPAGSPGKSRVRPAIGGLDVFIQSTSHNRKLIGGTEVLILR
jgi:hypothetical protein